MSNMSFIDKIAILGEVISSSGIYIVSILLFIILGFLFITTNKTNSKSSKKVYIIMYIAIIFAILLTYYNSLSNMFDYMMNNFFIAIYFPNLAIYLLAIIITNIITWKSIFNFKKDKIIRIVNIIIFCIMHFLLILILNTITNKNLDVFTQTSVYGNKQALALIELSSSLFIIWIIFLITHKYIRKYLVKDKKDIKVIKKHTILNDINKLNNPIIVKRIDSNNNINIKKTKELHDDILTIDDYKLLLNILKEEQARKERQKLNKQKEITVQDKYLELQELYKA